MMMLMMDKRTMVGVGLGLIASMIWGSWPVVSKVAALQSLSPLDIATLRFSIAGFILLPVLLFHAIKLSVIFSKGAILAVGAGAPYVILATSGINLSSSAHFGTIAPSTMLVFSTLGSMFCFADKLTPSRWLGIVLIISGIVFIGKSSFEELNADILLGDLMFVGCGVLWASFTLLCKFWQLNSWVATAMVSVVSAVVCLPISLLFNPGALTQLPVDMLVNHGLYQGVLVAIVALYCYAKSISILGAAKGAIFAALVPPIALVLGVIVLGESLTSAEFIGSAGIFLGMLFSLGMIKYQGFGLVNLTRKSN
ncbi:DMT family transporter [Agarivorans sp. QJM3NY_29]|uniref:DMT family transporter n=1 Tax=unclassified Agarivorans TaxID=2636026 RepID=UPI003D7D06BA